MAFNGIIYCNNMCCSGWRFDTTKKELGFLKIFQELELGQKRTFTMNGLIRLKLAEKMMSKLINLLQRIRTET